MWIGTGAIDGDGQSDRQEKPVASRSYSWRSGTFITARGEAEREELAGRA